jgi:hypothetical protein
MSELALLVQRLTSIDEQLKQLSARQTPATAEQVQTILEAARKGILVQPNSERLAQLLAPALLGQMPSNEAIAAATQQGVQAIQAAGKQAAASIEQAAARVPRSIRVEQEIWGFTGFKSLSVFSGLLLLVLLVASFGWRGRGEAETQAAQLEQTVDQLRREQKAYRQVLDYSLRQQDRLRKDHPQLGAQYFPK